MRNVLIRRVSSTPGQVGVSRNAKLTLERCTFLGLNVTVTPGGEVMALHSIIGGEPKPSVVIFPNTLWQGEENRYDFASLRVEKTSFTAETFADFQKLTGSEARSKWEPFATVPNGIGADEVVLKKLCGE